MASIDQISAVWAIVLLIDYLFGVTFGVVGGAIFGSVRENRNMSLLEQAPDPLSAGARVIFGLFTRDDDGYLRRLRPGANRAKRGPYGDDSAGSHGQGVDR
jgi:hypothetical protein